MWVASHQERLHWAFNQANQHLQTSAAARTTLFYRKARDAPLNVGQPAYLGKFAPGRAKIQDAWNDSLQSDSPSWEQRCAWSITSWWAWPRPDSEHGKYESLYSSPVVHQLPNILPSAQSQSLSSDASDESSTDSEELPTVEIHLPGKRIRPPTPFSSESDNVAEHVLRRHTTRDTAEVPPNRYGEPIPQEWY